MKIIRFEFTCSRPVPLYAHLCNQYLNYAELTIKVGYQKGCYFIEAEGKQPQLETLADAIAHDFLISVWLTDSRIALIDSPSGSSHPLKGGAITQEFCQQCTPQFGDNQSPQFGDLGLVCDCCHGERSINPHYQGLTGADIAALSTELLTHGALTLTGDLPVTLSLNPLSAAGRPTLLVCNPNTLNAQFHLTDRQVLALSSIEKPLITARAIDNHPKLDAPLYDLCFAYNRLLVILTEHLRRHGVDWLYIDDPRHSEPLAFIDGAWVDIDCSAQAPVTLNLSTPALHDDVLLRNGAQAYYARHDKQQYRVERVTGSLTPQQQAALISLTPQEYGLSALHSVNLEHGVDKHSAIIYFSQQHGGQIQTLDAKRHNELFFALPSLPDTGYDIYHQLEQSPQRKVLEKFKQQFPDDYLRLLDLKLSAPRDNLTSLWAIGAILLGLPSRSMQVDDLCDALMAAAQAHRGANSPRIDYPLTRGEAHRSLNWCKTLGTVMSFRLADDRDTRKLAFGMHDSLADYLANWIEHLDQNIGIRSVALAGSEWRNPLLCQRVVLRVGKNFPIKCNQQLAIDGNNHAIGALLLKKRRK